MRLKNVPGAREAIADSVYCIHDPEEQKSLKGHWHTLFGNDHPLHIEIGMGKGQFIYGMAAAHPEINYIGIEKYSSVLIRAIQKMEEAPLPNLRFIRMDAEEICDVFGSGEVDRIYLNFSDPWPKDRHAKRRLPSRQFLARYDAIYERGTELPVLYYHGLFELCRLSGDPAAGRAYLRDRADPVLPGYCG